MGNDRGLHGFLIWEISGDMLDDGSTPLIDATNRKILDQGFNCGKLRDPVRGLNWKMAPPEPTNVDWTGYTGPAQSGGSGNDFDGAVTNAVGPPDIIPSGGGGGGGAAPNPSGGGNGAGCSPGFSGFVATKDCRGYMLCTNGSAGIAMNCPSGTIFDVKINACAFASTVSGCGR